MADIEPQRVNQLTENSLPRSVPPWRQSHVLHDAGVSLNIITLFLEDARLSIHDALYLDYPRSVYRPNRGPMVGSSHRARRFARYAEALTPY